MMVHKDIREIHELTGEVARRYVEKYGEDALPLLEKSARGFELSGDLHMRNRMLRLRDEILISQIHTPAE